MENVHLHNRWYFVENIILYNIIFSLFCFYFNLVGSCVILFHFFDQYLIPYMWQLVFANISVKLRVIYSY